MFGDPGREGLRLLEISVGLDRAVRERGAFGAFLSVVEFREVVCKVFAWNGHRAGSGSVDGFVWVVDLRCLWPVPVLVRQTRGRRTRRRVAGGLEEVLMDSPRYVDMDQKALPVGQSVSSSVLPSVRLGDRKRKRERRSTIESQFREWSFLHPSSHPSTGTSALPRLQVHDTHCCHPTTTASSSIQSHRREHHPGNRQTSHSPLGATSF